MSNQTITMSLKEKKVLENKAKVGWKSFYIMRDDYDELAQYFSEVKKENKKLVEQLKSGGEVDLEFLKKQFIELYEKVGELTDCPVCFETLVKDNMDISSCGHTICKSCKEQICNHGKKECPICKKKYFGY
jgi:hypothetical protein